MCCVMMCMAVRCTACEMSRAMFRVSCVMCHVSCVLCHVSCVMHPVHMSCPICVLIRVWTVRYNRFHDQLILSAGTELVNLWSIVSVSSAPLGELEEQQ